MSDASTQPLWSDSKIFTKIKEVSHFNTLDTRSVTTFRVEQIMGMMRDSYEAELARLTAQVQGLEIEIGRLVLVESDNARLVKGMAEQAARIAELEAAARLATGTGGA